MKRLVIAFLAAFMLGGALAQAQQAQTPPFPDIPAGHWAADAVSRIAKLGIVIGFPDGTFRGNESFTRYQAALVVSRLLDVVNSNLSAAKAMTDQDIASLRNALQSLSSDVAAQNARLSAAEQAVTGLKGSVSDLQGTVGDLQNSVNDLKSSVSDLQGLQSTVSGIQDNVTSLTSRVDALEQALKNVQSTPGGASAAAVQDLQNQVAALKASVDTAQAQAKSAMDLANQNSSAIKDLQGQAAQNAQAAQAAQNAAQAAQNAANQAASGGQQNAADIAKLQSAVSDLQSAVAAAQAQAKSAQDAANQALAASQQNGSDIAGLQSSVASIQDNVTSNTSRISALEQALKNVQSTPGGASAAAVKDLQDQLAAQKTALDTAQAQAKSAQDLANQALSASQQNSSDVAQLQSKVAQNADAIDALNNVVKLLNDQVGKLQDQVNGLPTTPATPAQPGVPASLQDQVARNTSDIANIRDFAILLRKDQVAMGDRVSALEQADQTQNAKISDLDKRVSFLEQNSLTFSGSIEVDYTVMRLSGDNLPFDADRLWGLNSGVSMGHERDIGASAFSTGTDDLDGSGDIDEPGEYAQDRQDIDTTEGGASATLTLNIGFFKDRAATSDPHGFNNFKGVVVLQVEPVSNITFEDNNGDTIPNPYILSISSITTTFNIGAAPLMFAYGTAPAASFTPYVLDITGDNSDGGFVATVGSPNFLKFINPTVEVVYGHVDVTESYSSAATAAGGVFPPGYPTYCTTDITRAALGLNHTGSCWSNDSTTDNLYPNTYYRGARLTLSPFSGLTLGGSVAQVSTHAGENADVNKDNQTLTVYGGDASLNLSVFSLGVEYAKQQGHITSDPSATNGLYDADGNALGTETRGGDATVIYAKLGVDGKNIPILKSLSANYRSIPTNWDGIFSDSSNYPFTTDQVGFGAKGDLSLFIIDLKPYFDDYTTTTAGTGLNPHIGGSTANMAYGVDAQVNLFAGFSLTGFFHSVSFDGNQIDIQDTARVKGSNPTNYGDVRRDSDYDTGFGGGIKLDGSASNALIPGLNLEAGYAMINAGYDTPKISASADYTLNVSILTLTPYVGYTSIHSPDTDADNTVTLEAGTGLTTKPFNIFLKPSLLAAVNYRNTAHSQVATYTANEFQWSVGVALNEFLFEHSVLTGRYGSWTGKNINDVVNTQRDDDFATDISGGDKNTGDMQQTTGYEVTWNYYDLNLSYGAYLERITDMTTGNTLESTGGQAFAISYKVNF